MEENRRKTSDVFSWERSPFFCYSYMALILKLNSFFFLFWYRGYDKDEAEDRIPVSRQSTPSPGLARQLLTGDSVLCNL